MKRIQTINSHTGGEPTRIVIDGGPDLGDGSLADRRDLFRSQFDHLRRGIVCEPRGCDFLIGGLVCEPSDPDCAVAVIFFDTAGILGMCGHGMMGLVITLEYLGKITPGKHMIETPVGNVAIELESNNRVTIENVVSYRLAKDVTVNVPDFGQVTGDVAWGGNWFFLVNDPVVELQRSKTDELLGLTKAIRDALDDQGITGADDAYIDHVELFNSAQDPANDSRNFVLCPGGQYDRSPCGTGTSAKLACLAADGKLAAGEMYRQESFIGSVFRCSYRTTYDGIVPILSGQAWVSGETTLLLDPNDPFGEGIPQ